jgi:HlyD family secretion protein
VKEGALLAKIDDSVYTVELASANAQIAEANAGVKRAEADLAQMNAKLAQAERDWQRAQQLGASDALAQVTYDSYKAAYESAVANVAVGQASILQAQANVDQAKSTLQRAERNLSYTKIFSPVDGMIIDRRVNIGQTVVASLNAPSLFLIAKDLKRMQVWVAVNEADVGHIHAGQPVTFTSDAFPGETFHGQVNKVRLNAQMTQNVVTYTVEVTTDNSSLKLLPYLTANVQFEVNRVNDVLQVPNAALRWTPRPELIAPDARDSATKPTTGESGAHARVASSDGAPAAGPGAGAPGGPGGRRRRVSSGPAPEGQLRPETVWVKEGQYVRPVAVKAGLTDGTNTEVHADNLKEGAEVVIGEVITMTTGNQTTNPFAPPQMRGGPRGGQGGRGATGGGGGGGGGARGGGGR